MGREQRGINLEHELHRRAGEFMLGRMRPIEIAEVVAKKRDKGGNLDLYVHIPFCTEICSFCAFHRQVATDGKKESYVQALEGHMERTLGLFGGGQRVDSVFIGGGTPGLLTTDQAGRILNSIRGLSEASGAQVIYELHPENITRQYIEDLSSLGVSRFSVGVQNLSESERKLIGRSLTTGDEDIERAQILNELQVNYNLDLMFGTPNQTMDSWRQTVVRIVDEVHPPEITLYQYVNAHGSETRKWVAEGKIDRPGWQMRHRMYDRAAGYLLRNGYRQTSVLSFSTDQTADERSLLSHGRDFLGLGPRTYSKVDGYVFINDARTGDFRQGENMENYTGFELPLFVRRAMDKTFGLFARQKGEAEDHDLTGGLKSLKSEMVSQTYGVIYYMTNQPRLSRIGH